MQSVMITIQPNWCELIANELKKIDVRKTKPSIETPFKCFIYCTYGRILFADYHWKSKDELIREIKLGSYKVTGKNRVSNQLNGKVIGEFICDYITTARADTPSQAYAHNNARETRLTSLKLCEYATIGKPLYFWHISELKIYEKPKELNDFYARCTVPESKCKLCDNCYAREDNYGREYAVKELIRPPQSWCYVETP